MSKPREDEDNEQALPRFCARCREPLRLMNKRCRECGVQANTSVSPIPRWQRRLLENAYVELP